MALPRENRLKGKKEFDLIKKKGKLIQTPLFSLLILKTKDRKGPKFGFIVSKKIDQRAVVRNRIRRLLREGAKEILPKMNNNLKVIVLAKQSLKKAGLTDIVKELKESLRE